MTQFDDVIEPTGRGRPLAAELFAGVGGFHLALDRAGFDVVWSNQWEPATKVQHAFDCYEAHVANGDFQTHGRGETAVKPTTDLGLIEHVAVNDDIAQVLDRFETQQSGVKRPVFPVVPDVDLLVGGFPCQDYSVAKTLRQAHGLVGKKGVLWWENPSPPATQARSRSADPPPVPRERRSTHQVTERSTRSRFLRDVGFARRPRIRGRMASRQCRGLWVPPKASARLHHRSPRPLRRRPSESDGVNRRSSSSFTGTPANRVRLDTDPPRSRRESRERYVRCRSARFTVRECGCHENLIRWPGANGLDRRRRADPCGTATDTRGHPRARCRCASTVLRQRR